MTAMVQSGFPSNEKIEKCLLAVVSREAEPLVCKNRNGPAGDLMLNYRPEEMRFDSYAGPNLRQQVTTPQGVRLDLDCFVINSLDRLLMLMIFQ